MGHFKAQFQQDKQHQNIWPQVGIKVHLPQFFTRLTPAPSSTKVCFGCLGVLDEKSTAIFLAASLMEINQEVCAKWEKGRPCNVQVTK